MEELIFVNDDNLSNDEFLDQIKEEMNAINQLKAEIAQRLDDKGLQGEYNIVLDPVTMSVETNLTAYAVGKLLGVVD